MIRNIAGSVLFLAVGLGLSRFMFFLVFLVASSVLSVEEFSSLSLFVLTGTFLTYIFTFGLNIGLLKHSSNIEEKSEAECLAICRFVFKVVTSGLLLVVLAAASFGLLDILIEHNPKILGNRVRVCGLLAFVILSIHKIQYSSILTGLKNFKAIFIANTLEAVFLVPGLYSSKAIEDVLLFLCISLAVSVTYLAISTNKNVEKITLSYNAISLKLPVIFKSCLTFYLAGLMSMAAMWTSQAVFFSSNIDLEEFAKFSFAFRVYTPFIFLFSVISTVMIPYIADKRTMYRYELRDFIVRPIVFIVMLGGLSAVCIYALYDQVELHFDLKYKELSGVLGVLILVASAQGAVKVLVNKMIADLDSSGNLIGELLFSITLLCSFFIVWYYEKLSAMQFSLIILTAYLVSGIGYSKILQVKYKTIK
jgi:O-antigen/teichoic acid export membrane protein